MMLINCEWHPTTGGGVFRGLTTPNNRSRIVGEKVSSLQIGLTAHPYSQLFRPRVRRAQARYTTTLSNFARSFSHPHPLTSPRPYLHVCDALFQTKRFLINSDYARRHAPASEGGAPFGCCLYLREFVVGLRLDSMSSSCYQKTVKLFQKRSRSNNQKHQGWGVVQQVQQFI